MEEIFSYGECSSHGHLNFLQLVKALRSFMEVEVTEWLKLAVEDDSTLLPLNEYKNLLMESRFFPVQSDLDEVFKEIV